MLEISEDVFEFTTNSQIFIIFLYLPHASKVSKSFQAKQSHEFRDYETTYAKDLQKLLSPLHCTNLYRKEDSCR